MEPKCIEKEKLPNIMTKSYNKVVISGTGCALADFLYTNIIFDSPVFKQYLSRQDGDGGLCPGKLVFREDLEKFSGKQFAKVLNHIVGDRGPDAFNLGGPGLVSFLHVAQMLWKEEYETRFYGIAGNDEISKMIFKALEGSPLDFSNYIATEGSTTPSTFVFSDPSYNNGNGERSFVNNLGVAAQYTPQMLDCSFFDADIICLGGTALVPCLHDNLDIILQTAKRRNCITIVNTVYDFRSERNKPGHPWSLVSVDKYSLIDLLIMDMEEALKISGESSLDRAIDFFIKSGTQSFLITNGASEITAYSGKGLFIPTGNPVRLPVSGKASSVFGRIPPGKRDTTGCGDNFAGGVIASVARQLKETQGRNPDLLEAACWGVVSGGFACSYTGGAYFENHSGEKRSRIEDLYNDYRRQINRIWEQ